MNKSGNENRSVRNTKRRLQEGLFTLLQKKPINQITVKELTELVDVNRGTFYFHYSDVYDMLYKIEDDFFLKFDSVLNSTTPTGESDSYPYFLQIFTFLAENSDMCRIFFNENCDMNFFNRIKKLVEDKCCLLWRTNGVDVNNKRSSLYNAFIVNGCAGIMKKWLDDNFEESPEEISELVLKIISSSIKQCIM